MQDDDWCEKACEDAKEAFSAQIGENVAQWGKY